MNCTFSYDLSSVEFPGNTEAFIVGWFRKVVRGSESARQKRLRLLAAHQRNYKLRNPLKVKARAALDSAVRRGLIVRGPCVKCGAGGKTQAHHHDYEKPLDVSWYCDKCHRKATGFQGNQHTGPTSFAAARTAPRRPAPHLRGGQQA